MYRIALAALLAVAFGPSAPRAVQAQGRLIVIRVGDTASREIAEDMQTNLDELGAVLTNNVRRDRLVMPPPLTGRLFSRDAIQRAIDEARPGPDDALLFYYGGHGYIDNQRDRNLMLLPEEDGGRPLFANFIVNLLERPNDPAWRPRLVVALFDCCSVPPTGMEFKRALPTRPPAETSPLFESLFFQAAGTFSLVSSAPGEYSLTKFPMPGGRALPGTCPAPCSPAACSTFSTDAARSGTGGRTSTRPSHVTSTTDSRR